MKIVDVRCDLLTCTQRFSEGGTVYRSSSAVVRVLTDEGIYGLGDPLSAYHAPEAIPALVAFYRQELLGEDPFRISHLWRKMHSASLFWGRGGLGLSVIGAIDNALWDLKAKALNVPLYELLGGLAESTVRVYATGAASLHPLERTVETARAYVAQGFTAFKFATGFVGQPYGSTNLARTVQQEVEKMTALREAVGPDIDIIVDGHQGAVTRPWSRKTALAVAQAIEPCRVLFFEEPLPFDDPDGYALLRQQSSTPIAGGEGFMGLADFTRFFDREALDVAQPDVGYHGGITETLRIIAAAESRNVRVVLHNPSLGAGMMFGLHLAFARHSCQLIEILPVRTDLQKAMLAEPLGLERGSLRAPRSPGAGLVWDDQLPKIFPFVPGSGERQGEG
ncbi:MAG: enolase superfamily enzyme related to L-alanine-DL-glutamate epimerase [Verrucomicrobia bacterium]|nr:enolase superfamily enzyme related to L-alanine-DL-glutamate epimerase [Verrucomicrobiota bacterium]